jgi:hypothetical protein
MSKGKVHRKGKRQEQPSNPSRRKFIFIGLGAAAAGITAGYQFGLFDSSPSAQVTPSATTTATGSAAAATGLRPATLAADQANALRAANEMIEYYARDLNNPSALIHAVRGFGREFTLSDGAKAVDHLCARFAAEKEISGRRIVYFPREVEVHDDSFLKTFLEAGVSQDQPILVGSRKYTLRDLGESAKARFRCDPQNLTHYDPTLVHEHLPWQLIAFSILLSPAEPTWTNAYGEVIRLPEVIDRSLAVYEQSCSLTHEALEHGEEEPVAFREEIKKYSCFGLHTVYGFFSCLNHGYRRDGLPERTKKVFDLVIKRLSGDPKAIDREYAAASQQNLPPSQLTAMRAAGMAPAQVTEAFRLRAQIKFFGHAFEAINYALLHRLFALSAEQKRHLAAGERGLYENIVKLRAMDLEALKRWNRQFVSDTVVTLGHAARALKLLTPDNPDALARK